MRQSPGMPSLLTLIFSVSLCSLVGSPASVFGQEKGSNDGLKRLFHRVDPSEKFNRTRLAEPQRQPFSLSGDARPMSRRGVKSLIEPQVSVAPEKANPIIKLNSTVCNSTCLIPNSLQAPESNRRASFNGSQGINFSDGDGFIGREQSPALGQGMAYPIPLGYGLEPYVSGDDRNTGTQTASPKRRRPGYKKWNPNAGRDEYVYDGNDRGPKVQVDNDFNVMGLQTEDTIGHFDTLDGRRIVTPSNRVAIYAPRFGAVRRVDGVFKANLNLPVGAFEEKMPIAHSRRADESTTTKQHLAVQRHAAANRASGFIDQTRGVVSNDVTHLFGIRNTFEAFENLSLIRYGKFSSGETARLRLGLQSAAVWEDDLGLQVTVEKAQPVIVRDVKTVQEMLSIKSDDGTAILRVTKIASKIAAKAGEFVEFTIRFDNLSEKKIGNVTIIDNLTRRLEYVAKSSESSLKADFINKTNEVDSLMLRWEITEPVEAHSGGVIRFKCRVR